MIGLSFFDEGRWSPNQYDGDWRALSRALWVQIDPVCLLRLAPLPRLLRQQLWVIQFEEKA
jgi:hypothetical protein